MSEGFIAVPLHFTAEFLGFLVTAGAAVVILVRPVLVPGPASNRALTGTGFGLLAVAELLHGGAFVDADGAFSLLALRTAGFLFVMFGIAGVALHKRGVAAAFAIRDPVFLIPAVAAALVAVVAMERSFRGAPRALRRLSAGALLLAAAEVLTAAAPDATLGDGVASGFAYAAHGVQALGFVVLSTWLWTAVRSSIRSRYVMSFAALLVAVVLLLSSALTAVISDNIERAELERAENQARNAAADLQGADARDVADDVSTIAALPTVQESLTKNRGLEAMARDLARSGVFELDWAAFLGPNGRLLAYAGTGPRVERPSGKVRTSPFTTRFALRVPALAPVEEVTRPLEPTTTLTRLKDSVVNAAATVVPRLRGAEPAGIVAVGRFVDADTIEEIAARLAPAKPSLIVGRNVVATSLREPPRRAVPSDVKRALSAGRQAATEHVVRGRSYFSAFVPLAESGGTPIEAVLALSTPARVAAAAREGITRTLFLVTFGVGFLALLLAWLSGRRVTRPIQALTRTAMAVREGDLDARADVRTGDEVGQLGTTFNEMTESLLRLTGDLRSAAREEQRLRGRIETIVESMADGLIAVDADGRVLAFNDEAERLTETARDDALGSEVGDVLDLRDADDERVAFPLFEPGRNEQIQAFVHRARGDKIPVAVASAVLRGEGDDIGGAVAVLRDITRERELERMKSEFLSNVSHELRTPLTPIRGYAEILGRPDVAPEKASRFAKGILDSTARLERIVALLVDFAALEAGRLTPRTRPVDVRSLLRDLAEDWTTRTPRHDIVADVEDALPPVVGDERLLRRSLEEVLDNAVKFSPQGGRIRLGARHVAGNGRPPGVEVTIADEGIGIPQDDLATVFADFRQLDGSATRAYGGLGLGLAFVQRIVEAHRGTVEVKSEVDRGTTVVIVIPQEMRPPSASPASKGRA